MPVTAVPIRVLGVEMALRKFKLIGSVAGRDTGLILYRSAQRVAKRAKEIVPIVSGDLHDGIKASKLGIYDWQVTASSMEGGAEKEYASFVEYGTYKMTARPYLRPALHSDVPRVIAELKVLGMKLQRL